MTWREVGFGLLALVGSASVGAVEMDVANARSSNTDACGALLCLAGEMMGQGGGDHCTGYIRKYFEMTVRTDGSFNPTKTAKKRLTFLKQCKSPDASSQGEVNDRYGRRQGL